MSSVNLALPDEMRQFVEEQAEIGGYASPADYVCALIREAHRAAARQELEAHLLEGLNSPLAPMTRDDWAMLRQRILEKNPGASDE